jgi:hypothetical protein
MGKQTKLREAQRRAAEQALSIRLRAHTPARTEPAFINSFIEFAPVYRDRIETYRDLAVRPPEAWRCRLRVRAAEQRFLDLVRFTFMNYPIPRHLENAWTDQKCEHDGAETPAAIRADFCGWSILVGRGRSLYREEAHVHFTKLETHHFLTSPDEIFSTQGAFCYAIARAQTDDANVALRLARTKLAGLVFANSFWRDAVRFFAQNPTTTQEINDLIDFFGWTLAGHDDFTLRGRSLPALRRRMAQWRRMVRAENAGPHWCGRQQPNARYEISTGVRREVWQFTQIKSGGALVEEAQQMQHCVGSYRDSCVKGLTSIWSLTCQRTFGEIKKCLTIEVSKGGCIIQCHGFANRAPTDDEFARLQQWAADYDLWGLMFR